VDPTSRTAAGKWNLASEIQKEKKPPHSKWRNGGQCTLLQHCGRRGKNVAIGGATGDLDRVKPLRWNDH